MTNSKKGGSLNNRFNSNRNSLGQTSSGMRGNTLFLMIVIVILAAGGLFLVYKYLNSYKVSGEKTKTFVPFIHDAKEAKRFTNSSLPQSTQGNEYNYNVWVYVSDYSYRNGEDKCILYKGPVNGGSLDDSDDNINNQGNPGVWLLKRNNTLRVQIGLETDYSSVTDNNVEAFQNGSEPANGITGMSGSSLSESSDNTSKSDECDMDHFPLQTWVNLNVSLTNNVVDVYMNGSLVKSCAVSGAPLINNSDLHVCAAGGFNGFISNLKVSNKALSSKKIRTIYKKGPSLKQGLLGTLGDFFSF